MLDRLKADEGFSFTPFEEKLLELEQEKYIAILNMGEVRTLPATVSTSKARSSGTCTTI